MKKALPPFSVAYTPNIPEILHDMSFTLAISTYQAGKMIFLSATSREKLIQLPRTFDNAMGVAIKDNKMAIACKKDLVVLKNFPGLAQNYPAMPNTYDSFFIPQCRYYTGTLNLHDMNYVGNKLTAINTLFSCMAEIGEDYSFQPIWQPEFITELAPEDRCHLNGMAVKNDKVEYVTALGNKNSEQGWRENKTEGGVLIHVPTNKIVLSELSMPHSPRIYNNKVYYLNSAQGELCVYDPEKDTNEVICNVGGFGRGMDRIGDFLFIGISKLRHTADVFKNLPIAKSSFAGVTVVYLPQGKVMGQIKYQSSVDEIYDVKILPGLKRPGILNEEKVGEGSAIAMPDATFWGVSKEDK